MAERKSSAGVVILILAGLGGILFLGCLGIVGVGFYRYQRVIQEEGISYAREVEYQESVVRNIAEPIDGGFTPESTPEEPALNIRAELVSRLPDGTCKVLVSGSVPPGIRLEQVQVAHLELDGVGPCRLEPVKVGPMGVDFLFYTPAVGPEVERGVVKVSYVLTARRGTEQLEWQEADQLSIKIPPPPAK